MSDKLSGDEVSNRVLAILQSSDFTKTLESFNDEKLKPTMNIMAKKINKAKKKLKKLQKRQRKQDMQGVSNTADQWPHDADQWPHELVEKFLTEPREPYTPNMISEEKKKQSTVKKTITMDEFIKFRDKMARLS